LYIKKIKVALVYWNMNTCHRDEKGNGEKKATVFETFKERISTDIFLVSFAHENGYMKCEL